MITKSDFVSFQRCNYQFFCIQSYNAERVRIDTPFISFGHLVGKYAHCTFINDVFDVLDNIEDEDIEEIWEELWEKYPGAVVATIFGPSGIDWSDAATKTQDYINDTNIKVIFEAAFVYDGCACLVDVLIREPNGSWSAYEVKSFLAKNACNKLRKKTKKDRGRILADDGSWLDDIAFQKFVVSHILDDIKFGLMCVNDAYERGSDKSYLITRIQKNKDTQKFLTQYFTSSIFNLEKAIEDKLLDLPIYLAEMKAGLKKVVKSKSVTLCKRCEFKSECRGTDWGGDFYRPSPGMLSKNISTLEECDLSKTKGGKNIRAIQRRILKAEKLNAAVFDKDNSILDIYPLNESDRSLDFESLLHPFPQYSNQPPWWPISFMFSYGHPFDIDDIPQVFMADDPSQDPRPFVIKALCDLYDECHKQHSRIFHWSPYDKTIVGGLIEYAKASNFQTATIEKLMLLKGKMVDLCAIVRQTYYHPDFAHSFSIKRVGPHFSGIFYTDCNTNAVLVGLEWLGKQNLDEVRKYCRLDTIQLGYIARGILGIDINGRTRISDALVKFSNYYELTVDAEAIATGFGVSFAEVIKQCRKGDNVSKLTEFMASKLYNYTRPDNQNHKFDGIADFGIKISVRSLTENGAKMQRSSTIGTGRHFTKFDILESLTVNDVIIFVDIIDFPIIRFIPVLCAGILPNGDVGSLRSNYKRCHFVRDILMKQYHELKWITMTAKQLRSLEIDNPV